jgi:hypothetical protein
MSRNAAVLRRTLAETAMRSMAVRRNRYPVQCTYDSLEEAVNAGKYDWAEGYVTADKFGLRDRKIIVDTELVLHWPKRIIGSDDELLELKKLALRPATLQELLAFGVLYPALQRKFPIFALGSIHLSQWYGKMVPFLSSNKEKDRRILGLDQWVGTWLKKCRFLAVPC